MFWRWLLSPAVFQPVITYAVKSACQSLNKTWLWIVTENFTHFLKSLPWFAIFDCDFRVSISWHFSDSCQILPTFPAFSRQAVALHTPILVCKLQYAALPVSTRKDWENVQYTVNVRIRSTTKIRFLDVCSKKTILNTKTAEPMARTTLTTHYASVSYSTLKVCLTQSRLASKCCHSVCARFARQTDDVANCNQHITVTGND